jgi:CO/xanthine dehydrogenase FAD-binding subunit
MNSSRNQIMPTLKAYHRPATVAEALQLLARPDVNTAIISGGTHLVVNLSDMIEEVVDLQATGLNEISYTGQGMIIGATVTLQSLVDDSQAPPLLREMAKREGPNTLRQAATLGGLVASPHKESELLAALLLFEAEIEIQSTGGRKTIPLPQFLRDIPTALGRGLVSTITLSTLGQTAADRVARTPADRPIVAVLARRGPDNQVRLALCGVAATPILLDSNTDIKAAINPPSDFRGSREYRRQMAATLARRVLNSL